MSLIKTYYVRTVVSALIGICLAGCGGDSKVDKSANVPEVPVIVVQAHDLPVTVEFVGQTKGDVDAAVRARVEGIIQAVHFKEGTEVTAGQLLYTIDPAPYEAKRAEALAQLSQAETRLVKAVSDLGRVRPLAKMKAVSQRDLDSAVAQEGVAKSGVDAAKAAVDSANINLGYTKITAPITGMIGITKATVGEFVGKDPNPIVLNTVSQLDPIRARFAVSERDYLYFSKLAQAQKAAGETVTRRVLQLVLSDGSVHTENGEVVSVDSQIDPTTGSIAVEASFPNPGKILRPGQFAKIRTSRETIKGAVSVPRKAVRDLQGLRQVLVITADDTVEVRGVKVKEEVGDVAIIETGLVAGERIVPQILQRLNPGTKVKPVESKPAA